jgi:tetratricopeptide (TPR) repeat protein
MNEKRCLAATLLVLLLTHRNRPPDIFHGFHRYNIAMAKRPYRALIALICSLLLAGFANAQTYRERFVKLLNANDAKGQLELLKSWEKELPNDPELYVSFFNYYFLKSRQETVTLTTSRPQGESIPLSKENDDKIAGYIGTDVTFTRAEFDAGISYIDRGITKFPDRLDMRFGKMYALGQIRNYDRFVDEIVKTVDRSDLNKNAWSWKDGKPLERPREFMLRSIQDYVVQLFDAGDEGVKFIKPIAETVLKYYPDHVESLSNLSVFYSMKGDFEAALVPLQKAEKLAPDDFVIIGNIAYSYYKKHDKANATKYYQKLAQIGDAEAKKRAASILSEMKDWK